MLRPLAVLLLATTIASAPTPWPDVATGEQYAREVLARFTPAELDRALAEKPEQVAVTLRALGSSMMTIDSRLQANVSQFLIALAGARAGRTNDVRQVLPFLVVDPMRFAEDREFRKRIVPLIRQATLSAPLRGPVLRELNGAFALDFDSFEAIAAAWESIPHRSSARRVELGDDVRMPDDTGAIETSIYSINSGFFPTPDDARAFLKAVRASAPKRRILVLADERMAEWVKGIDVTIVPTFSRPYTPWPRDPFIVARTKAGGVVLVNRPNLQPEREEDANMVRALAQSDFDARWTVAPIPFHNGHILLTRDAAWISIHTVEIRALQMLQLKRVPVETFGTPLGIEKYLDAVRDAASELETLYRRPVRFVHPLAADVALMRRLGGGGGFDLDSIVTLLPETKTALVGDFSILKSPKPPPPGLQTFLDTIAAHLAKNGLTVRRLPLLNLSSKDAPKDYLLTWNNVVLEHRRAEGFASLNAEADAYARRVFAAAGYNLVLFPPLTKSVTHSGGYRCASNHLRSRT